MLIRELILERLEDRMETLGQWWNDPTIYVSFTALEKIGINPQSEYNTPLGVYAYPLKEMYDNIEQDKIPFAGDQPWIQVLKSTHVTELSQYSDSDLANDISKLKQLFGSKIKLNNMAKTAIRSAYSDKDDELLLKSLHTDQPFDEMGRRERQDALIQQMNQDGSAFDYMVKMWSEKAIPANRACSKFWNITRNIALDLSSHKPRHRYSTRLLEPDIVMTKPESLMWNKIFRMLGYVAFSDKKGIGLIHPNEPISAVFLTPSSYTHIATVKNIQKTATPRTYSRIRELTYSLERAKNDINYYRSGKLDQDESGIEVEKAYEFRNHVLADWLDALTTGNTKYIQFTGLNWQEHEAEDFPNFMKVLLSIDFNQFPVVAKFLVDNNFYRSKSYQDSVAVAKEFIAISPPSKYIKQYIDAMLANHAGWEAAFVLDSMDDTENNKQEIGAIIAKNIMKATGITWDKLKSYLGYNYYSLTSLISEKLLKDIFTKP